MKISRMTPFLAVAMMGCCNAGIYAVNAKSGLLATRQPDSTILNVMIVGNENNHIVYSEDGYVLMSDAEGYYVFAEIDAKGNVAPSGMRATNVGSRDAETRAQLRGTNTGEIERQLAGAQEENLAARRRAHGLMTDTYPTLGAQRALVVLVEFADKEFSVENPNDFYTRMLNEEGYSDRECTGSARDYFIENSMGQFVPQFDVYGPVKLEHDIKYYGANDRWGNDANPQKMAIEACEALDAEIDFSLYDCNGDGIIENVFFYYAGYGEADGGGANTIWPHSTHLSLVYKEKFIYDGVELDRYACSNELQSYYNRDEPDGIGTFCHEFSHVMGLPDLYATMGINLTTPGDWDLMDHGSYNNASKTPPYLSAYERYALGWLEPRQLILNDYMLPILAESNIAYIYRGDSENEYYLFENRQKKGFDAYIPDHGMLVWHIDYKPIMWENNMVNNDIFHQYVDLVEADGRAGNDSRHGDPFPGARNLTQFTKYTTPAFSFWDKTEVDISIKDIGETAEGIITFRAVPVSNTNDDETEEKGDEEENGVGSVGTDLTYRIEGNRVTNLERTLEIYSTDGKRVATLTGEKDALLPQGLYIAVKGTSYRKFIIP